MLKIRAENLSRKCQLDVETADTRGMRRARRLLLAAAVAGSAFTGIVVDPVHASGTGPAAPATGQLVYTVVKGDSLSLIANKLHVTLSALLSANNLQRTSVIVPGRQLVVPLGGTLPAPAPAPATSGLRYTVVSGDGLSGIAMKLHVTLNQLLAANQLTKTSVIHAGQQLLVPTGGTLPAAPVAAPPPPSNAPRYTVVSGDGLTGIAMKLNVNLSVLLTANGLQSSSVIHPGQQLIVPVGGTLPSAPAPAAPATPSPAPTASGDVYIVRSGDFLIGIAAMLGVPLDDLLRTNSLTRQSLIYPGKRLLVPAGGHLPGTAPTAGAPGAGAPSAATGQIDKVLAYAKAQLGEPYRFNAAGPDSWDCSGLTMMAYAQIGVTMPHYSGAQALLGTGVDWTTEQVRAGDLVFLESSVGSGVISHVGIAINSTQWIQAPRTGDVVRISTMSFTRVVAVRRFVAG